MVRSMEIMVTFGCECGACMDYDVSPYACDTMEELYESAWALAIEDGWGEDEDGNEVCPGCMADDKEAE